MHGEVFVWWGLKTMKGTKTFMKCCYFILASSLACSVNSSEQVCNESITSTTPSSRFIDNKDGTVLDTMTNLIWLRCAIGQTWTGGTCEGLPLKLSWRDSLHTAKDYTFANYYDWKLPNIKQLSSIVERACAFPSVNTTIFPSIKSSDWGVWSSTASIQPNMYTWGVIFSYGYTHQFHRENHTAYILLVRAREAKL